MFNNIIICHLKKELYRGKNQARLMLMNNRLYDIILFIQELNLCPMLLTRLLKIRENFHE